MQPSTLPKNTDSLPRITREEATRRHLLTEEELARMRLLPNGTPVARGAGGDLPVFYYDPSRVRIAPASHRPPRPSVEKERATQDEPLRINARRAETLGYYSKEALARAYYEPTEAPVALLVKKSGEEVPLYDRATCRRLPMPCVKCGRDARYRAKLCLSCYKKELAKKRAAGDAKRAAAYGMARERILFFDLELTGVYDHDEVLSVSIVNGNGETVIDTLTRPVRTKRWKRTERIHGITPAMVKDAPTLAEIAPRLTEILNEADRLIAFGTSTDFAHLKRMYATREERNRLRGKLVDCAAEFSHYLHEHEIELTHQSLSDAMAQFSLDWNGIAHTSAADAQACRKVFERLFPNYYESEAI